MPTFSCRALRASVTSLIVIKELDAGECNENQFFLFSFILSRRRHPASPSQGLGAKMKTILILWNTERESTNLRKFLKFKKDED